MPCQPPPSPLYYLVLHYCNLLSYTFTRLLNVTDKNVLLAGAHLRFILGWGTHNTQSHRISPILRIYSSFTGEGTTGALPHAEPLLGITFLSTGFKYKLSRDQTEI